MIGKTLYAVKIVDNKVELSSYKILSKSRNKPTYKLDKNFRGSKSCRVDDVGNIIFLTKKKAIDCFIKRLEISIILEEDNLKRKKSYLQQTKALEIPGE